MIKKIVLYFLMVCLVSSCAVHKDFPYLCFLPGCIAKQFGLPSIKEIKARSKARRKGRQAKRVREKSKKDNDKNKTHSKPRYDEEQDPVFVKKDSLRYSFHSAEEDKYIVVRFTRNDKDGMDSILVKYPESGSDISVYEKQILKIYIDSSGVEHISLVRIREHSGSKYDDAYYEKHATPVKRKLADFFIELGIPPGKIRIRK